MSLTLGKSFNRQYKIRLPFKDYFYDISIFYHTDINFNLFDIKSILKYNTGKDIKSIQIKMFKNIETSDFCINCLNLEEIDNRLSKFINIKPEWRDDIYCIHKEKIHITNENYLKIYIFKIKNYNNKVDDFIFLLAERKNYLKKYKNGKIITTLSGIQISTPASFEYIIENNFNNKFDIIQDQEKIDLKNKTIKLE